MLDPNDTRDVGPRVGTPLWLYLVSTTVAGGVLLAVSLFWFGPGQLRVLAAQPLTWVMLCMVIIGELRPIVTPSSPTDDGAPTSLPFSFALVIFYGLPVAGLTQVVATVIAGVARGNAAHRTVFNSGQYVLSFGVADAVLRLFGPETNGAPWVPEGPHLIVVVLAAGGYFLTNLVLVECAAAMH